MAGSKTRRRHRSNGSGALASSDASRYFFEGTRERWADPDYTNLVDGGQFLRETGRYMHAGNDSRRVDRRYSERRRLRVELEDEWI